MFYADCFEIDSLKACENNAKILKRFLGIYEI
ncbi:hypothetical protein M972_111277 [Acetivibrio thermocellus AD2]|jgi:hypothetical protein|uniref:Uncharacterized protein n=1 Tax=Acetivibrio thermocellus AD2 TaxID=1138384 RepID=A0AB36TFA5_ACETH|nr:hypothetical protein Clo1313_1220 [Acetivibrio thermocellus DSM 1313]ALX08226.1 hypothetical protein AD2_01233 [Acetivibrio thermocellus AD2]ANV75974.1 hypothetical protein LQRI_1233 [Acetivibrio thermocellus DSM 2360]EIC05978.1 hypothetical protein YSBL_0551 [Acetivibrio thermocellus YS]CDG35689.1 hypothetical protein CTHBC1_1035 [Acetivibrio thermocellus BC1]SOD25691.1 hypothetical protein SAMN04515622_2315 [Acetivibrio thermocellus]